MDSYINEKPSSFLNSTHCQSCIDHGKSTEGAITNMNQHADGPVKEYEHPFLSAYGILQLCF